MRVKKLLLASIEAKCPKGGVKMRKYEIMFIVSPTLEEAAIKKVAEDVKSLLENNDATVEEIKDMGQRDLAYEIKKHKKGYYFLFTVTAPINAINEFNHMANVNENMIRSLVVKIEE